MIEFLYVMYLRIAVGKIIIALNQRKNCGFVLNLVQQFESIIQTLTVRQQASRK